MTKEEKRIEINKLNSENQKILNLIDGYDKNNPNDTYIEIGRPIGVFRKSMRIKDEILMTVVEMLENKIDENNKKLYELLGGRQ